ncbi:hypothetical protein SASPL_150125 [Salvia splendens]|uniref:F-box domain-containing protein n=1 Tax=Salvia splendens TaxID=180675 RepID=A0A8X8Z267_SALSN|nr:hypothetical protein SASPL_150125 [Salvia splendens]
MEEDRISELPDEILEHILSFIDTSEAVGVSILSKRWKHLRPSHHNIRLKRHGAFSRPRVPRSVSQFLSRRDDAAPLHDFHLLLDTEFVLREDEALVEECAFYAINHGAQSFHILAPTPTLHALPAALFTSATLRELVISQLRKSYTRTYKPTRLLLPNLKTLCLDAPNLYFTSDLQGKELFSGLPELEKLFLIKFPVSGLVLKAPKLRVLEIIDSCCLIEEISAPLLTSLRYEGDFPLECSIMNVPMLEQVYLDIFGLAYNPEWLHLNCVRLLHQLGNATTVSLTLDTLKREKEDRISELPDDILQHILSFIDTAEAVRASILSKRWKPPPPAFPPQYPVAPSRRLLEMGYSPKIRVLEILQSDSIFPIKEISAPLLTSFRYMGVLDLAGGPIEQRHPPFPNLKCLKVIKGSNKISTMLESVMNYSTIGTLYFELSLKVEIVMWL